MISKIVPVDRVRADLQLAVMILLVTTEKTMVRASGAVFLRFSQLYQLSMILLHSIE